MRTCHRNVCPSFLPTNALARRLYLQTIALLLKETTVILPIRGCVHFDENTDGVLVGKP